MRTLLELIMLFVVALLLGTGSFVDDVRPDGCLFVAFVRSPHGHARVARLGVEAARKAPGVVAHLARSGRLPLTSTTARYFLARTDSSGSELTSDCEYLIEGWGIDARWWSLAVYDDRGSVIENPSGRYSFNSDEALRRSDGTFRVNLAGTARPENWLPSGTGAERRLVLMLRVYGPRQSDSDGIGQVPDNRLPRITRTACN